ncbi:transaldolase family protein [Arthrobacter sp. H5]|uniref:transaldolase family protein n=1 Tax=Arthrobacter sp. H5 TaxID=1267973 RepID=UPI0012DE1AF2|nr:transaldolase family protein [Arthrobacter sp. H5]
MNPEPVRSGGFFPNGVNGELNGSGNLAAQPGGSMLSEALPDTHYVEQLVAPGTVNTMPGTTLSAFEDHGHVRSDTMSGSLPEATQALEKLRTIGADLAAISIQLENEGLQKFSDSWEELGATIAAELNKTA